jgi:hypothetical protein
MEQQVFVNIQGQVVSNADRNEIIKGIVEKSNNIIKPGSVVFIQ